MSKRKTKNPAHSEATRTGLDQLRPTEPCLAEIGLTVAEPSAQNSEHQRDQMVLTAFDGQDVRAEPTKKPDQSWTVEQLWVYAKGKLASSAQGAKEAILVAHKSAVALFWAGAALWLIRDKLKKEERWVAWQKANKLARSTVLEAVALYENAKSPDALVGLGITEAKERFGVVKAKPAPSTSTPTRHPSGRRASPAPKPSGGHPAVPP
jgi:hypothetical protein